MKRLPASYAPIVLFAPLLLIAALMVAPFGCGSNYSAATPIPTVGAVEVGFVDSPTNGFQQISFNIVAVRLNPSTNPAVPDSDPNWVTITPAAGLGSAGDLAIDFTTLQNRPKIFNTMNVAAQQYFQVEVIIDPNVPGTIIPSCSQTTPSQEGCVNYNVTFGSTSTTPPGTTLTNLRTSPSGGINVTNGGVVPLVLDMAVGSPVPPAVPGGNYTVTPTITVASSSYLANVTGNITVTGSPFPLNQTLTAEVTGTNQVVVSLPVPLLATSFVLPLPATPTGSTYDLVLSGGAATTAVLQGLTVTRGQTPPTQNFAVTAGVSTATITGTLTDGGTNNPVEGGTVNLLQPTASGIDCAITPTSCVVTQTATTSSVGMYTLSAVPFGFYAVEATGPGTNTVINDITVSSQSPVCINSTNTSNCSFTLPSTFINGSVTLNPAPAAGNNQLVLIMAETAGTGNLLSVASVIIPSSLSAAAFTIEVPTNIPAFDLIASAQDAFNGIGTPFTGHNLGVASGVTPGQNVNLTLSCLGHGSILGVANSADAATQIRLFKNATNVQPPAPVQLMSTLTGQSSPYNGQFSFCAPPDTYVIQRFELNSALSTATPAGTPTTVVVPTPAAISTPCPSICGSSAACPGVCGATVINPL